MARGRRLRGLDRFANASAGVPRDRVQVATAPRSGAGPRNIRPTAAQRAAQSRRDRQAHAAAMRRQVAAFQNNARMRSIPRRNVPQEELFTRGGLKPQMFAPRGLGYYDAFAHKPDEIILSATTGPATPITGHSTDTFVGGPVQSGQVDMGPDMGGLTHADTTTRLMVFNPGSSDQVVGVVYKCVSVDGMLKVASTPIEVSQFNDLAAPTQNHLMADRRMALDEGVESIPLRMSVRIRNITEALAVGGTVRFLRYNGGTSLLSSIAKSFSHPVDLAGSWTTMDGLYTMTFEQYGGRGTIHFDTPNAPTPYTHGYKMYYEMDDDLLTITGDNLNTINSFYPDRYGTGSRMVVHTVTNEDVAAGNNAADAFKASDVGMHYIDFTQTTAPFNGFGYGKFKQVTSTGRNTPLGVASYFKLLQQIRDSSRTRVLNGKELVDGHQSNLYPADFVRSMTFSKDTTFEEAVDAPKYCTLFILLDEFTSSNSNVSNTYEVNVQVQRAARYAPGTLLHALAREFRVANAAHASHTAREQAGPHALRVRESYNTRFGFNFNPRAMQFGATGHRMVGREVTFGGV